MEPEITAGPIDVIGFSVRTKNADEASGKGKIGPLWGRVMGEKLLDRVPGRVGSKVYGVYTDYESDHNGLYTLVVGVQSPHTGALPEGATRVTVKKGRYAVFTANGEMPGALIETWGRIWASPVKRAYTTDFELHDPADPTKVQVQIAVK